MSIETSGTSITPSETIWDAAAATQTPVRTAAETIWNIPAIRSGVFSFLSRKDLCSCLVLSKGSFTQVVHVLWKELDLDRYEAKKSANIDPARFIKYHNAVRRIDLTNTPFANLVRLTFLYPLCTKFSDLFETVTFDRESSVFRNITLVSSINMAGEDLAACAHPELPDGIPVDWEVTRRYRVCVVKGKAGVATSAMVAWLEGRGIFASTISLQILSTTTITEMIKACRSATLSNQQSLDRLSLEMVGGSPSAYIYLLTLLHGRVRDISLRAISRRLRRQINPDDIWLTDIRTCLGRYRSVELSVAPGQSIISSSHSVIGEETTVTFGHPPRGQEWMDQNIKPSPMEITIRLDQQVWSSIEIYSSFPPMYILASELLCIGGPLCSYSIHSPFNIPGLSDIADLLTGLLRREMDMIIARVRDRRPRGWSRKLGGTEGGTSRQVESGKDAGESDSMNEDDQIAYGKKRKAEDLFDGDRKIKRRMSF